MKPINKQQPMNNGYLYVGICIVMKFFKSMNRESGQGYLYPVVIIHSDHSFLDNKQIQNATLNFKLQGNYSKYQPRCFICRSCLVGLVLLFKGSICRLEATNTTNNCLAILMSKDISWFHILNAQSEFPHFNRQIARFLLCVLCWSWRQSMAFDILLTTNVDTPLIMLANFVYICPAVFVKDNRRQTTYANWCQMLVLVLRAKWADPVQFTLCI